MPVEVFSGAKIALLCEGQVLVYRRDDKPGIPFPGCWDLPGGGREGSETALECALRELHEEFALVLPGIEILWSRRYPGLQTGGQATHFFVAPVTSADIAVIRFGNEGQYWRMMPIGEYLALPDAIPHLQRRLVEYLAACIPSGEAPR